MLRSAYLNTPRRYKWAPTPTYSVPGITCEHCRVGDHQGGRRRFRRAVGRGRPRAKARDVRGEPWRARRPRCDRRGRLRRSARPSADGRASAGGAPRKLAAFAAFLAARRRRRRARGRRDRQRPTASAGARGEGDGGNDDSGSAGRRQRPRAVTGGYTFVPERTTLVRGVTTRSVPHRRRRRRAVRGFDLDGGVRLHLIVVRRDFAGYQHLHPRLAGRRQLVGAAAPRGAGRLPRVRRLRGGRREDRAGHDLFVPGGFTPRRCPPSPRAKRSTATASG